MFLRITKNIEEKHLANIRAMAQKADEENRPVFPIEFLTAIIDFELRSMKQDMRDELGEQFDKYSAMRDSMLINPDRCAEDLEVILALTDIVNKSNLFHRAKYRYGIVHNFERWDTYRTIKKAAGHQR